MRTQNLGSRNRAILRWILIALCVHLVPLFLPRNEPKEELSLARMLSSPRDRIPLLKPLLDNARSTPGDLRDAADLVLAASTPLAEDFLREARKRGSEPLEAELLLARICRARGDNASALQALDRARNISPASPRPDLVEAEFRELDGDSLDGLQALRRAHRKAPDDRDLTFDLARALAKSNQESEARALIDGMKPSMSAADRWVEHGKLSLSAGEVERATGEFAEAAALQPTNASHRYLLGAALFQAGELDRAEPELREAARLDPRDFRAAALLCALLRESLRQDEATGLRMVLQRQFPERSSEYSSACPP